MKNDKLQIESEDSLLNFVIEIYSENPSSSFLFDYVIFSNVSKESLLQFYEAFDVEDIGKEVWKMIVERAMKASKCLNDPEHAKRYKERCLPLLYENGKEFKGIVSYLTQKTGGNIHTNGTIEVSSNDFCSGREPWNLLDLENENYFCANSKWDVWICLNAKFVFFNNIYDKP